MQETDHLSERVKNIMLDIMAILYENNIRRVHMGAMMRLLGVADDLASKHDGEYVELDDSFGEMLIEMQKPELTEVPAGAIIH